jgi:hypothetical protein
MHISIILSYLMCINIKLLLKIFCALGNFKELCTLYVKSVPDFENMYSKDTNYSSWRIQNELVDICASSIKETILNTISATGFFSIICDEARLVFY